MKRRARWGRRLLITTLGLMIGGIAFLEIGSRYYRCPPTAQAPQPIVVCDAGYARAPKNELASIQALVDEKGKGIEPSSTDLGTAVSFVPYEDMPGLNGATCGNGLIFVRDSLGRQGKLFVARHELEHVFQRNGMDQQCSQRESCATMTAARLYPAGFIETVLSSLYIAARESPTIWCFLFGSWSVFRIYLLPR